MSGHRKTAKLKVLPGQISCAHSDQRQTWWCLDWGRETGSVRNRGTERQTVSEIERQRDRETDSVRNRETERQTVSEIERQRDRQCQK